MKNLLRRWNPFKAGIVKWHRASAEREENMPAHEPVMNIVDSTIAFLRRFVFLKNDALYFLVALWIVATHLQDEFEYSGYLFVFSPEPQSGKTRFLDVLNLLVANSSGIQVSPTPATLYRTATGRTQLFDEIDTWVNHEALRSVLNAGFQKGAKVVRMDQDPTSGLKAREFSVFGPKVLSGIGFNRLTRATRDRTFAIAMVRQREGEKRERFRLCSVRPYADILKQRIASWAAQHRPAVLRTYIEANFPHLEQFSDRTIDIAEPLAAIVEVAIEGHALSDAQATLVHAVRETRNEQHSQTPEHGILRHLLRLASVTDPVICTASELATTCRNLPDSPTEYTIGHLLRNYGFKPKSHRNSGEEPRYRYVLSRKALQEIVDRWAGRCEEEFGVVEPLDLSASAVVGVVGPPGNTQERRAD